MNKTNRSGGIREMISIALPMVVAMGCDTAMIFTDRLFLSRLGPELMSAALGGGLTAFMLSTFFIGLIGYSTALVAQYLGSGQKTFCAKVVTQAMLIAVIGYPIILLCRPFAYYLFELIGISPEQLVPQKLYFNILIFGSVLGLLRTALSSFFSGVGKTRVVMLAACVAMVVNAVMNYALIYGKLGFPALGIVGSAYGTIIGSCMGLVVLVATYLKKQNRREYFIGSSLSFNKDVIKKLLHYGYPAGLEMFLNLLAFNTMVMMFQSHGLVTATAATVMFNWDMVSFVPLIGVEIGVTSLVGRAMGAGNPELAHASVISGLKLGSLYSAVIFILFVGFSGTLVGLFRPFETGPSVFTEAFPMAVFMIKTASIYVIVESVLIVFVGALRGAGDTLWAMCLTVSLHWAMVATSFVMLRLLKLTPQITWVAIIILFVLSALVVYMRYRTGKWKTIKIVEPVFQRVELFHEQAEV